jgi:hypothetical protein
LKKFVRPLLKLYLDILLMPKSKKCSLEVLADPSSPKLTIGDFTLFQFNGSFWLHHKSGEGMQCKTSDLEKTIKEFYDKYF